jgi:hypothetical protein
MEEIKIICSENEAVYLSYCGSFFHYFHYNTDVSTLHMRLISKFIHYKVKSSVIRVIVTSVDVYAFCQCLFLIMDCNLKLIFRVLVLAFCPLHEFMLSLVGNTHQSWLFYIVSKHVHS